jgi:cold shock CspA family protein
MMLKLRTRHGGLAVSVEPAKDASHGDFYVALRDCFRAVRRRLEDHERRLRGDVKHLEHQPEGRVKMLDEEGGYGFLETREGREVYFHRNSVLKQAFSRLKPGSVVRFAEEMGEKGPQASSLSLLRV